MDRTPPDLEIVLNEDYYRECNSPVLPIPMRFEDMQRAAQGKSLSRRAIADNLLAMVRDHPEKMNSYRRLLVHSCLYAGGEAANMGDHLLSNQYFLQAAQFAPGDFAVRQNLARSYQHLGAYPEAIHHYQFVIMNNPKGDLSLWVYFLECLYAVGNVKDVAGLFQTICNNLERGGRHGKLKFGMIGKTILSKDKAPEELTRMFDQLFYE